MKKLNALQFLRDDHKRIRGLFTQTRASHRRAPSMEDGVIRQLMMEVDVHSRIEEQIFYPAVFRSLDPTTRALIDEFTSDHIRADGFLGILKRRDFHDPKFRYTLAELINSLEEHIEKEEESLFPLVEKEMSGELESLGAALTHLKTELMKSPEFSDAQPDVVQNPNGGEQMRRKPAA